jgi:hypothetical protein
MPTRPKTFILSIGGSLAKGSANLIGIVLVGWVPKLWFHLIAMCSDSRLAEKVAVERSQGQTRLMSYVK